MKQPRRRLIALVISLIIVGLLLNGCALRASRAGIPPEVETLVTSLGEDANEGRYEKIHSEAAEEWRKDATLDQTISVFSRVKEKLGKVKNRRLHSASEETTSSGRIPGHSFVLTYDTKFEHGDGMETFTVVERDGHWQLARYFVNSTALQ